MSRPYRDPPDDPRELVGDWVIDGAGRGAARIGEGARLAVKLHMQTREEILMITIGNEVTSIPVATMRKILG